MKLYTLDHSPYSTRVRAQVRHKNLPIEFVCPRELRNEALKTTFPLGQLPVLQLDDGELLAESTVILNYLEEMFPQYPLRGKTALDKARANMFVRWSDTHLAPVMTPIIREAALSGTRSIDGAVDSVRKELHKLDRLIISQPDCRGRDMHIGDICATVSLSFLQAVFELCSSKSLFDEFPVIEDWWKHSLQRNLALLQSVDEMLVGIAGWLPIPGRLDAYPAQGLLSRLTLMEKVV
ncbi:MAG: glutathione S-transferase family protein [Pseudomonadales bacterium]|tara:strand:- start:2694 stop:3401 length:708 start_codon:yes stop_codon:yes gene_type:complete